MLVITNTISLKMKNSYLILIILNVFLLGCHKDDNLLMDHNYPTTIKALDQKILDQKRTDFLKQNQFITSSLNQFGFCDLTELNFNAPPPPLNTPLTTDDAKEKVRQFLDNNKTFVGLVNLNPVTISGFGPESGFYDGSTYWYFGTNVQKIDTIEVIGAQIRINIKNSEVTYCAGNWYPNIYIPAKLNFDQKKAKLVLKGRTVWHSDFGGKPYSMKITDQALATSEIKGLKIYPLKSDKKIQLFVAWKIYVPEVFYILYVDVMTGEVIAEQPTIIS